MAGTFEFTVKFSTQKLRGRLTNKNYQPSHASFAEGKSLPRQKFFDNILQNKISSYIKVYWFVTFDDLLIKDIPAFAEAEAIQLFYINTGTLPIWNKKF